MAVRRYSFLDTYYVPQGLYIALTAFGCVFIAIAKTHGVSTTVSVAVPIAIMFGYCAFSWGVGKLRIHDEQVGDNLYYMGFLFTLSSMAVSLYQFGTDGGTDGIVRNFGIAVLSTITGIGLRIIYNQIRRDPADVERATRYELADMTRRVRTELESVAREFAEFRRVCNQMLEEGFDEIAKQAERNGEQVREAFGGIASKATQPVQDTSDRVVKTLEEAFVRLENGFSGIAERVEKVAATLDKANSSMAGTVSKFETQADTVAEKLAKVVIPDEVLKTDVVNVLNGLAASVGKFTQQAETLSKEQGARTDKLSDAILSITASQKTLLEKFDKQAEQDASTRQLLARLLERNSLSAPYEVPPIVPDAASAPPEELSGSETATQAQPGFATVFPGNRNDAGHPPVQAPEPVVEKAQSRLLFWR